MLNKLLLIILLTITSLFGAKYTAPMQIDGAITIDSKRAYNMFLKNTIFIDVRPQWMVQQQQKIKNAVNYYVRDITRDGLAKIIPTKKTPFIIYCNGIGCALSEEAIRKIVPYGYKNIYFYRDGYPAWRYFKLPIE